ncbi:MAG: hypothetical protein VKJ64_14880 [Leptolyngbyaceae bacterium]|nr:hypothetical protein [Leptolyngbyaceae bacterium]
MTSSFQDDIRENAMRQLFDLRKDETEGRSGIDAYLEFEGRLIPFELKTTSKGSVTTVRDFGLEHIKKWEGKHWLFGFFIDGREYYKYGTPKMMQPWIERKSDYIRRDFMLAEIAPSKLTLEEMYDLLGIKEIYTYEDARKIHKMQYKKSKYLELQDLEDGYSPHRMLEIVKNRARYLIQRGSTLNNPHIPFKYFSNWIEITENHAVLLRELVATYFREFNESAS